MGRALITPGFPGGRDALRGDRDHRRHRHASNLYLHSALVQSRKCETDDASIRQAIKFNTIDATVALTIAFYINAGICAGGDGFLRKQSVTTPVGSIRSPAIPIGFESPT